MSDNDNDRGLGDEVGHELRRRADGLPASPLTIGEVKGRAGSIRRTRRLATAAGLAAVVAVVVPVAVFAGGGDRADGPLPSTNSPSAPQVPSESPTRAVDPDPVQPTDTPTYPLDADHSVGAAPAVAWLDGTTLTRPGLESVDLPATYFQFAVVGEGVVGIRSDDTTGDLVLDVVDADQSVSGTTPGVQSLVSTTTGAVAAWVTHSGVLETLAGDVDGELANGLGAATAAAIRADGSCERTDDCRIFLNGPGNRAPRVVDAQGDVTEIGQGARTVEDVSVAGLVAVMTSASDTGSCSSVLDPGMGDYLWKTCDYSFLGFSPGGTLLGATGAYRDGFGLTYVTVLDAGSGQPVAEFDIDAGAILQTVWEDESHLLAVTYDDGHGWRILRLGLDGTIQTAVDPDGANQDHRPYFLAGPT